MSLISFVVVLIVVGVLLWAFNTYVTMIDGTIKQIINIVVIIAVILWCLTVFGILGDINAVRVPHV